MFYCGFDTNVGSPTARKKKESELLNFLGHLFEGRFDSLVQIYIIY